MTAKSTRSSGALATLAVGFLASALLRAGDVVAALPGEDGFGNALPAVEGDATPPHSVDRAEGPEGALTLVAELKEQRAKVAEREAALTARAQLLEAMEARLRQRLEELEKAQAKLESTAVLVEDAAGRDVRHLADMYAQMKPKSAAEIFNQMPPSFAAGFLGSMPSDRAALIMANMQAENAYAVSLLLAGRNIGRGDSPAIR